MKNGSIENRNFILLMLSKCISIIGTDMQDFALSLYVLKITGSSTSFASALALAMLPKLIFGPFGGVLVDWFDKKKIIIALDFFSFILVGGAAIKYAVTGEFGLVWIYIMIIVLSLVSVFYNPANGSMLPYIVKEEKLLKANSINSAVLTITQIITPILAGIVYGFTGLLVVFIINALSFFLATVFELFIKMPKTNSENQEHSAKAFMSDFAEGLHYIKNDKVIFKLVVCSFFINFTFNPLFSVGLTYILKIIMKATDVQYGMVESVLIGGMLLGTILVGLINKKLKLEKIFIIGILICTALVGMLAVIVSPAFLGLFETSLPKIICLCILVVPVTAICSIINISLSTMLQTVIPSNMLGRIFAVIGTISMGAIPAGQMLYGKLFAIWPANLTVLSAAIIILISLLIYIKPSKKIVQTEMAVNSEQ